MTRIKVEYGIKELKPVEYRITSTFEGPWWWRQKRFWIESDYGKLGSFDSETEARVFLRQVGRALKDTTP